MWGGGRVRVEEGEKGRGRGRGEPEEKQKVKGVLRTHHEHFQGFEREFTIYMREDTLHCTAHNGLGTQRNMFEMGLAQVKTKGLTPHHSSIHTPLNPTITETTKHSPLPSSLLHNRQHDSTDPRPAAQTPPSPSPLTLDSHDP